MGRSATSRRLRTAALLLVIVALGSTAGPTAAAESPAPYSAHSMVYACCTPHRLKERMFAEAKAMGSGYIRLNVEIGPIFEAPGASVQRPDWSGLDDVIGLSRRYRLPAVAVLYNTPVRLSSCPRGRDPGECPPTDYREYGRLVGTIASHARGAIRHWEVLNEPDGGWAFTGGPSQYAWMLRRSYDAIKAAAPGAQVLIGGVMGPESRGWLARVFDTPGADARHRFDIANVHLRGTLDSLPWGMARFAELFGRYGFRGPTWVTEHGYPGETRYQRDPLYRGGEPAQARYLRQSLPTLVKAGAGQVFVTLRDCTAAEFGDSEFASEGVLHVGDTSEFAVRRKQAFARTRWLAALWPNVPATRRDVEAWRTQLDFNLRRVDRYARRARRERRLVRRYRRAARRARTRAARRTMRRRAAIHERLRRGYVKRAEASSAEAWRFARLVTGYREGP